tara:strand:+ start:16557 stop:17543 length:987 start_codon:yes stop_codon:yes gene_type:complete
MLEDTKISTNPLRKSIVDSLYPSSRLVPDPSYENINFEVEQRLIYRLQDEEYIPLAGKKVNVRVDNGIALGVVGDRYKLTPYTERCDLLIDVFNESSNEINLDDSSTEFKVYEEGRKMKAKIYLPGEKIEPAVGDISRCEYSLTDSTDGSWAANINWSLYRYWCDNGCDHKDLKLTFYTKHTKQQSTDEAFAKLKARIIKGVEDFRNQETLMKQLINTRCDHQDAMGIFKQTLAAYRNTQGKMSASKMVISALDPMLHDNMQALGKNGYAVYNTATEWATHIDRMVYPYAKRGYRGQPHNVRRDRSNKVAKMLNSNPWKERFGNGSVT